MLYTEDEQPDDGVPLWVDLISSLRWAFGS